MSIIAKWVTIGIATAMSGCGQPSALETEATSRLKATLRDPSSTTFENISTYPQTNVVCGEFNPKNAFGAYAGPRAFVYANANLTIEGDDDFMSEDAKCLLTGKESRKRHENVGARLFARTDEVIDNLERMNKQR